MYSFENANFCLHVGEPENEAIVNGWVWFESQMC